MVGATLILLLQNSSGPPPPPPSYFPRAINPIVRQKSTKIDPNMTRVNRK